MKLTILFVVLSVSVAWSAPTTEVPTDTDVKEDTSPIPDKSHIKCGTLDCPDQTTGCITTSNTLRDKGGIEVQYQCIDYRGNVLDSVKKTEDDPYNGETIIKSYTYTNSFSFKK